MLANDRKDAELPSSMASPFFMKEKANQMSAKFDHTASTCASGKEWSTMKRHDEKDDTDKKPKQEVGFFSFASSKIEKLPQFNESESESDSESES